MVCSATGCVTPVIYGVSSYVISGMLHKNMTAITLAVLAAPFVMASVFQFVINSTNDLSNKKTGIVECPCRRYEMHHSSFVGPTQKIDREW